MTKLEQQRQELNDFAAEQAHRMTVPHCMSCGTRLGDNQSQVPTVCPECDRYIWGVRMQYS